MSNTHERHTGSFGRQIVDRLAEQLAEAKKRAKQDHQGESDGKPPAGAVYNLNTENIGLVPEFTQAKDALEKALAQNSDAPLHEQRRIAEILSQAAQAILNK